MRTGVGVRGSPVSTHARSSARRPDAYATHPSDGMACGLHSPARSAGKSLRFIGSRAQPVLISVVGAATRRGRLEIGIVTEPHLLLRLTMYSVLVGLAAFCGSYAFHVWRHRNRGTAKQGRLRRTPLGRAGLWLMGLGLVVTAGAAVHQRLVPREGVLTGERPFTVRARDDLRLKTLRERERVEAGDVLASFTSPTRRAELE